MFKYLNFDFYTLKVPFIRSRPICILFCFVNVSLHWECMSRDMTKPTKWLCAQWRLRSAWASAQSDQSLRCALNVSSCGQRRLWSDWADAQADLSLRWAHTHFVGFVMSRLIFAEFPDLQLSNICVKRKPLKIWATTRQNVSSGVSDQARHKPACAATEAS